MQTHAALSVGKRAIDTKHGKRRNRCPAVEEGGMQPGVS